MFAAFWSTPIVSENNARRDECYLENRSWRRLEVNAYQQVKDLCAGVQPASSFEKPLEVEPPCSLNGKQKRDILCDSIEMN